ncbi:SRPBCC family protein [Leifsonia sp. F6_8S_P_1B]|uniref:SRPBCC family protein n=1 Tax=Leifsonia williamsii TaxID=3035919 RepID=A0ABT8K9J2_9MICO|nr:SRPBCC family protein [Leifsonia williamsii]MDN4613827.1 SRPBCC family protein [Leifsonia williamsii]
MTLSAWIGHPPARVFPPLADPARWPAFAPAVEARSRVGDGPPTVGSRWAATDRILGPFRAHFEDVLEEVEPDRRVVWHSTAPWNSRVEYVCTPERSGTRVDASYAGDISGWLRVVGVLPRFAWVLILRRDFRGLERMLDAEDRARVPAAAE